TAVAAPGSPEYLLAAGVMAFWAGIIRIVMGVARLGLLVNFVSDSVVVGFTAGAGMLIIINQVRHVLRLDFAGTPSFFETAGRIAENLGDFHPQSLGIGLLTMILLVALKRLRPKWPGALIAMSVATAVAYFFNPEQLGIVVLGELPRSLPPFTFTQLPLFDETLIREMAPSILAVALIGLIEAASISRAVAARSGQYLNSDQEFVGQGLANVAAGAFSGYPVAGSLTRSLVNYEAGAKTQMSAALSAVWALIAMLLFAPVAAYLPRAALAGLLIVTGTKMINTSEMARIWRTSLGDLSIMIVTWVATILLPLEFAVLVGVLISFARYIAKTSAPGVYSMLPDDEFAHFEHQPTKPECPQLAVITIMGSLYFGAAPHVEDAIRNHMDDYPEQKYLLLRMHRVNQCDISGIHMLETIVRLYRQKGGDVFMVGLSDEVWEKINLSDFDLFLGVNHFLDQETAIKHIFDNVLNPSICVYGCRIRAWKECQNLPKNTALGHVPLAELAPAEADLPHISPQGLWMRLNDDPKDYPLLIDVREPEEYNEGHLRPAQSVPLPHLFDGSREPLPRDRDIVFICRSGRRSLQVTQAFIEQGYTRVYNLEGGMLGMELADLTYYSR
ncbi:MAG: STAS domain-containing protein, partial [Anaerolineales bacterium]|nr:STAS domain-containing protein [Anaerolineales bacterium]